jgi:Arc/MetJ family transcription regulator
MRTNIVLNDVLVKEAMRYCRAKSKSGLVDEALRTFVELRSKQERLSGYAERLRKVREAVGVKPFRESASDIVKHDRNRR